MMFKGIVVPPGKEVTVPLDSGAEWLHVTQIALGPESKEGKDSRATLSVLLDGKAYALGTLSHGTCDQFPADLVLDREFKLSHNGE